MRLGIDFGTTRTIVAYCDRGNYPVVSFFDAAGDAHDFFPSVVAIDDDRLVYGFKALEAAAKGAPSLRSFKRALADADTSADQMLRIGDTEVALYPILTGYLIALRDALSTHSSYPGDLTIDDSAVVAVPAHAHSAQRFLTLSAFRSASFNVIAMLNEPSAAGFEYTSRQAKSLSSRRTRVIVYDLGGGTFDASLITVEQGRHEVLASVGLNRLGGDDFDAELAKLAAGQIGMGLDSLSWQERTSLMDQCREAKEHLSPQTRRMPIDIAGESIDVPVDAFYEACAPLVARTLDAMAPLVDGLADGAPDLTEIAGVYLVGGGASLPLVPRMLRERFGRRVFRSPYPAASTAIGLAIAADPDAAYQLTDRMSRGFGVFREADSGRTQQLDPLIDRDEVLTPDGPTVVTRHYRAAHNVGHFRYVEYTSLDAFGAPSGGLMPFGEVLFPFERDLQDGRDLSRTPVVRADHDGDLIEESYTVDENGIVRVDITDLDSGFATSTRINAWRG